MPRIHDLRHPRPNFPLRTTLTVTALAVTLTLLGCSGPSAEEHVRRARSQHEKGETQAALIELKNALQKAPNNAEARQLAGLLYLEVGDGPAAEKELKSAERLGVPEAARRVPLTRAALLQGRYQYIVQAAIEDAARGKTGSDDLSAEDAATLDALRGAAYAGLGNIEQARRLFDAALARQPGQIDALVGTAVLHAVKQEYDEAREALKRALDAQPSSAEAWAVLGEVELVQGNPALAEEAFGKAIERQRYVSLVQAKRALARVQLKKFAEAEADIKSLKAAGLKDHPYVAFVEGVAYSAQGKHKEALLALQAASAAAPSDPAVQFYLGVTHLALGNREQALAASESLYAQAPKSGAARRVLGAVQMSRSDYGSAAEVLDAALRDAPDDPVLLRMLATASLFKGDAARGLEYARRLAAAEPGSRVAADLLRVAKLMAGEKLDEPATVAGGGLGGGGTDDPDKREFLEALSALRAGKVAEALEAAKKMQERRPRDVEVLKLLALGHMLSGKGDLAKGELEEALKIKPNEPSAARNLALLEAQAGNLERARTLLVSVTKAHPRDEQAALLLAEVEARRTGREAGVEVLKAALARLPSSLAVRAALAQAYLGAGHPASALTVTRELSEDQLAGRPDLLLVHAKSQMATGDVVAAQRSFQRLTEVTPRSAEARFLYGESLARGGEAAKAEAELKRAIEIDRSYLPARVGEVNLLVHRGQAGKAREMLAGLRQEFGERPEFLEVEGWVAFRSGDYATATERFTAVAGSKSDSELTLGLARSLWAQREQEKALEVLRARLQVQAADLPVLMQLAASYVAMDRRPEGISTFRKVLESYPDHVPALNDLAWVLQDQDLKQALTLAERAHRLQPNNPAVLDTLGTLRAKGGDLSGGAQLVRRAVELAPDHPQIQLNLGRILVQQKKHAEARAVLEALLAKVPEAGVETEARALLGSIPAASP